MNKNSKRRAAEHREACKKSGRWPSHGFKPKSRPFPAGFRRDERGYI